METPDPGNGSGPKELAAAGSGAAPVVAAASSIEQGEKQKKGRAKPTCSVCNNPGHNRTTCPQKVTVSGNSPVAGASGGSKGAALPKHPEAVGTKKVTANTARSLRQSAHDFKVAREEANKKELKDYNIYHYTRLHVLMLGAPEGERTPVATMEQRLAIQILVEDEWFKTRVLPAMNSWGEDLEQTILLAPDRAEEVAAYLDGEVEPEGGLADEALENAAGCVGESAGAEGE